MTSFKTKFGSKQVERASRPAFDAVVAQCDKKTGELGSIVCQLHKNAHGRLTLTGLFLPPKWAGKINEVLRDYKKEQEHGYEPDDIEDDDIPF